QVRHVVGIGRGEPIAIRIHTAVERAGRSRSELTLHDPLQKRPAGERDVPCELGNMVSSNVIGVALAERRYRYGRVDVVEVERTDACREKIIDDLRSAVDVG